MNRYDNATNEQITELLKLNSSRKKEPAALNIAELIAELRNTEILLKHGLPKFIRNTIATDPSSASMLIALLATAADNVRCVQEVIRRLEVMTG